MGDLQGSPVNGKNVKQQFDDLLLVALTEAGLDEIAAKPDVASPTVSENTDSSSDHASNDAIIENNDCMLQPSCSSVKPEITVEDDVHGNEDCISPKDGEVDLNKSYMEQAKEPYFLEASYEKKRLREVLISTDALPATSNRILVTNVPPQKRITVVPLKGSHSTPAILRARRIPAAIPRQIDDDRGIVRSRRLESADTIYHSSSDAGVTLTRPFTISGSRSNNTNLISTTPTRGRFVIVRRRTPNGTVLIRRPADFYNVQPRRVYISRDGEEVLQGTSIRAVNSVRQQPVRLVQSPTVFTSHTADGRGRRVLTHSTVHYETGHQYLSTVPKQAAYVSPRQTRGSFNLLPRASTSTDLFRKIGNVSEYPSPLRHVARVSSAQSLADRRFSFDSNVKTSNFHVKSCGLVKQEEIVRKPRIIIEQEEDLKPLVCRSQKIENLDLKTDFVPNIVAKYEEVDGSEKTDISRVIDKNPIMESFGSRKAQIKIEEPKKEIKFFLEEHSSAKPVEKKDVVKQDRKLAKDEMKAALEAGVSYSTQEIDDEVENLGYAETYADYRPAKLRSGLAHPDFVVETASLSSVTPPDIQYNLTIPEELVDTGCISTVQLEAVLYACQAHEIRLPTGERTGYLIGDGAGVGKGRSVACIIFENYLLGRKRSIWLSVSSDLKFDAERDLRDIGASKIKVHALNKFKYAKISGKENGNVKKGCIFATYSSLIGECRSARSKYRTRLKQLIQWCGKEFDGVIVLDECHRAKNLVPSSGSKPTKTGRMVLELQKALPNARIVYASATGATEPRNMAYMVRLGLWGEGQAFPKFDDFINAVERHGVGAMEIVAMDMKQRGLYLARQLSFRGVTFRVEEVPLSANFVEVYDDAVKLWLECRRQFQAGINSLRENEKIQSKQIWGQFWAAHQRFFKYLCIGAKVDACVKIAREAVKTNKCVVIGLQSTGEARTLEVLDDVGGELTDFVSTAKSVLTGLISKHFPTSKSHGGSDIFTNFDKMFNDFDRPVKRKSKFSGTFGGYSSVRLSHSLSTSSLNYPLKRSKVDDEESVSSTVSKRSSSSADDSCVDSDDDSDRSMSSGDEDEGEIKGDEDTWLKRLMNEVKSSDEESSDEDPDDFQNDTETDDEKRDSRLSDEADDDVNPFACDFSRGEDPWASKQQIISDSPQKEKKKSKKRRKPRREIKIPIRKKALESEAMMNTADAFISSSRIIDESSEDLLTGGSMVKAELLAATERLGARLPPNTLDQLINELGGPEYVAEMTGRKGRVVSREDGEIEYELRHAGADVPLELMNMDEKEKFMRGEKLIAVISEAASSGISLQSDRRAPNRRRRVHITLELPWSADKAIQQFGRTHRSNQVSAPEYIFLISELAGEKRFASVVAKRLESLGALTHGDRRATESRDLSQFNLDTRYGRNALDVLLKSVIGFYNPPMIPPPENYKPGNFMADMARYLEGVGILTQENGVYAIEKDSATIAKFLNRILGLPVHAQNALFQYFADIVAELVKQAKHDGSYDMGIMDLGMGGDEARKLETRVFLGCVERGSYRVEIHKIGVERGVSWEDAVAVWSDHHEDEDGFYISKVGVNGRKAAILVYGIGKKMLDTGARLYCVTRPSTGRSAKLETLSELSKRFRFATPEETENIWRQQYEGSRIMCQHKYFHGRCKSEAKGVYCETGRRTRTYFVLSGSVLSVWPVVEEALTSGLSSREIKKEQRMQIIRVRTEEDLKIVGLLILPQYVRTLVIRLEEHCGSSFVEQKRNSTL